MLKHLYILLAHFSDPEVERYKMITINIGTKMS